MAKTNIEHLNTILSELRNKEVGEDYRNQKLDEAIEFVDAIEEEITDLKDDYFSLEKELRDARNEIDTLEEEGSSLVDSSFVGLDTIEYRLTTGNLVIQQRMDDFIEQLQKENCVTA